MISGESAIAKSPPILFPDRIKTILDAEFRSLNGLKGRVYALSGCLPGKHLLFLSSCPKRSVVDLGIYPHPNRPRRMKKSTQQPIWAGFWTISTTASGYEFSFSRRKDGYSESDRIDRTRRSAASYAPLAKGTSTASRRTAGCVPRPPSGGSCSRIAATQG